MLIKNLKDKTMGMDELINELIFLIAKRFNFNLDTSVINRIPEFNWFKGQLDFYQRHEKAIMSIAEDMEFDFDGNIRSGLGYYMNAIFKEVIEEICQKLVSEWDK